VIIFVFLIGVVSPVFIKVLQLIGSVGGSENFASDEPNADA